MDWPLVLLGNDSRVKKRKLRGRLLMLTSAAHYLPMISELTMYTGLV